MTSVTDALLSDSEDDEINEEDIDDEVSVDLFQIPCFQENEGEESSGEEESADEEAKDEEAEDEEGAELDEMTTKPEQVILIFRFHFQFRLLHLLPQIKVSKNLACTHG